MPFPLARWLVLGGVAFVASLVTVRLIERHARRFRLVDIPNARSSHATPRPRGGGTGIIAGIALAMCGAAWWSLAAFPPLVVVFIGAAIMALTGLWDDARGLSALSRLVVQAAAAAWIVIRLGGWTVLPLPSPADVPLGIAGSFLTIVWIVGVTNFYNFMDGLDGLAAGQAAITLVAIACAMWGADLAGVALVIAAAACGFLVRNWPPAAIFMGDVGSASLGFLLATLPLVEPAPVRSRLSLLVGTSLALFLLDPALTLVVRTRRRERLGVAHRDHAYQRIAAPGTPHTRVVAALLAAAGVLSAAAVAAFRIPAFGWWSVALAVAAFATEWRIAARARR